MADVREVRIEVTYLPTDESWQSKILRLTEEEFDELKDEISLFTSGAQTNLSFEDEGGDFQYFNNSILSDAVVTLIV